MSDQAATVSDKAATADPGVTPKVVYLMHHIPRTGGSTIRDHLREHLTLNETFIHLGSYGRKWNARMGTPEFHLRAESDRRRARIVTGHQVTRETAALLPWARPRFLTWLRDPADRIVSLYNQNLQKFENRGEPHDIGFEDWYEGGGKYRTMMASLIGGFLNLPSHRLSPRAQFHVADRLLSEFWFVSTTERMDEHLPRLLDHWNVPADFKVVGRSGDKIKRRLSIDDTLRRRIHADFAYDLALYRKWREREPAFADPPARPVIERYGKPGFVRDILLDKLGMSIRAGGI